MKTLKMTNLQTLQGFDTTECIYYSQIIATDEFGRIWRKSIKTCFKWELDTPEISEEEYKKLADIETGYQGPL